jgi:exo-beta-1,3-glucanase (GH17 family)
VSLGGRSLLCLALIAWTAAAGAAGPKQEGAAEEPECNISFADTAGMARMAAVMGSGRFVAYQPTSLQVVDGRSTSANPASIRADLKALRPHFDGLITYTAIHGNEAIPGIASALGYRAMIIGVWDPYDEAEVAAALDAAHKYPKLVAGLSLGNEIVYADRHGAQELAAAIAAVRRQAPQLPLSTSEPFHIFDDDTAKPLLRQLDFLLPIVHPVFQPWFRTASNETAAQFVVNVVANLSERYCGPILVKEVGLPTAPDSSGFSEQRQAAFFAQLRQTFPASRRTAFAYFSAFDAPWRANDAQTASTSHPEEAHWGLYNDQRQPKPVIEQLPRLQ